MLSHNPNKAPDVPELVTRPLASSTMDGVTARDFFIVRALTHSVPMLTLDHVARAWFSPSASGRTLAKNRLRKLMDLGYVERFRLSCKQLPPPTEPVLSWSPGEPSPGIKRFREASYQLKKRWHELPRKSLTVYTASKLAAYFLGSFAGGPPKIEHAPHDLVLSDLYLIYREKWPAMASRFVHEQVFRKAGHRIADPDVFVVADPRNLTTRIDNRNVERIVESGGAYGAERVAHIVRHAIERGKAVEIW